MITRHLLALLGCLLLMFTLSPAQAQVSCIPLTNQNTDTLALVYAAEGFMNIHQGVGGENVLWSPDSRVFSVSGTDFHIDNHQPSSIRYDSQAFPIIGGYRPDGSPLAFGFFQEELEIWHGETGDLIYSLDTDAEYIAAPTLSPDGKLLVFVDSHYRIQVWDITTGERLEILEHGEYGDVYAETFAFSPDGSLLVAGSYVESPVLWDIASGAFLYDLEDLDVDNHVHDAEFSPDGTLLAIATYSTVALIGMENNPLRDARYLREYGAVTYVLDLAFSPDGSLLAFVEVFGADYDTYWIELWDIATGTVLEEWESDVVLRNISFSPDGCWLAATSADYDEAPSGYGYMKLWGLNN